MLAVQGPGRARDRGGASLGAELPPGCAPPRVRLRRGETPSSAAPATRARTGSRSWCRPDAATDALGRAARRRRDAGRARRARHAAPGGLLSPLRQRPVDSSATRSPAGLGWCCKEETGFIGSEAVATARAEGHGGEAGAVRPHRPRHPAPGQRGGLRRRRGGRGHQRQPLALPRAGHRHGLRRAPTWREPGTELEIDVRGRRRARAHRVQAPVLPRRRSELAAEESYPEDLKYHPEHDWARIDGDTATFGITWYAQDSLGEVVFYEPPEVGADVDQGPDVHGGRVGQGRLRRLRAPLGRGRRGQRRSWPTAPR